MPPSFSPATDAAALPADSMMEPSAVGVCPQPLAHRVSAVRRDHSAALDPADTFDYFQAQGEAMRQELIA